MTSKLIPNVMPAGFSGCCGIIVINNHIGVFPTTREITPAEALKVKEDAEQRVKDWTPKVGLLLLSLNHLQIASGLEEPVLDAGFKVLVKDFHHAGTQSKITLYGYELHEAVPKKQGKSKFVDTRLVGTQRAA